MTNIPTHTHNLISELAFFSVIIYSQIYENVFIEPKFNLL